MLASTPKLKRTYFDDRLKTAVGLHKLEKRYPDDDYKDENSFNWSEFKVISRITSNAGFRLKLGLVSFIKPSSTAITLGTTRGFILLFSYAQKCDFVLGGTFYHRREIDKLADDSADIVVKLADDSADAVVKSNSNGLRFSTPEDESTTGISFHQVDQQGNETQKVVKAGGEPIIQNLQSVNSNRDFLGHNSVSSETNNHNRGQKLKSQVVISESSSAVTCITFSADLSYMAVGYSNGVINIWDLSKILNLQPLNVLYLILPSNQKNSHSPVSILDIYFIGDSNNQLIASDLNGTILYHHLVSKFFQKYVISEKLIDFTHVSSNGFAIGTHNSKSSKSKLNQNYLICNVLPLGNSNQITDQVGIIAVLSKEAFVIYSMLSLNNPIISNVKSQFKINRPKFSNGGDIGTLDWFPCMKIDKKTVENAKLAFSWSNVLTIVEIDNKAIPSNLIDVILAMKDKDKALSTINMKKTAQWRPDGAKSVIIATRWINYNIILVFVRDDNITTNHLLHYSNSKLKFLNKDKEVPNSSSLTITSHAGREENHIENWDSLIQVHKQRLFLISNLKIHIGRPITWADNLLLLIWKQDYLEALSAANHYYHLKDKSKLAMVSLPFNQNEKQALIEPYLISIMKESMAPVFFGELEDQNKLIEKYMGILAYLFESGEDLTSLLDILELLFENSHDKTVFFDTLEHHVLSMSIKTLPPTVLKSLVENYISNEKGDIFTEILCVLDLKSLDIDLTVQLCRKHKLRDSLIYIWNVLFEDYSTPFMKFIEDILNECISEDDSYKVYSYISFILTGRQYPTDRFIEIDNIESAKTAISNVLFCDTLIDNAASGNLNSYAIFPYLCLLLHLNSFELVSTLNEFFEDPYLNESDISLSRQFIVDALLDIYEAEEKNLTKKDQCHLAIFIARNFSKYSQFLRISESVVSKMITILCENNDESIKFDCELALQSIIPYYESENEQYLVERLSIANYHNVLIDLYRSNRQYGKVLQIWLSIDNHDQNEESMGIILENAFSLTNNSIEYVNLVAVVRKAFEKLVKIDVTGFVDIIERYCTELHLEVLNLQDESLKFEYLHTLFEKKTTIETNVKNLLYNYVKLSCRYQFEEVYLIVDSWKYDLKEIDKLSETFKFYGAIDSLSLLLIYQEDYTTALNELTQCMEVLETEKDFQRYLKISMDCCDSSPMQKNEIEERELNINESLWLKLINRLVVMANKGNREYLNKGIQDCFRRISDSKLSESNNNQESFMLIFNKFLNDLSKNVTTMANIREILQEVFIGYSYEEEMHDISLKMLNKGIVGNMNIIKGENLKGWIIKSKNCASCAKALWGPENMNEHYFAWETNQFNKVVVSMKKDTSVFKHLTLILFKCDHGYHSTCLQNLSGKKSDSPECVICCT